MNNQTIERIDAGDCIRTNSGVYINVFEPEADTIRIEDITHALSNMPRWGGHLPRHYTVAHHVVICSRMAYNNESKYEALHHDDSEAYLMDIPSPIKKRLNNYKKIEHYLMTHIANKFNFNWPVNEVVHSIDRYVLEAEFDIIMLNRKHNEHQEFFKIYDSIVGKDIKSIYLDEHERLSKLLNK
jgi:5'-deoxynucleotidase YfbR-like HD superfamily hydrolase